VVTRHDDFAKRANTRSRVHYSWQPP
jgi:hypothetical protein